METETKQGIVVYENEDLGYATVVFTGITFHGISMAKADKDGRFEIILNTNKLSQY